MRRNRAVGQQRLRRSFGTVFLGESNAQVRLLLSEICQAASLAPPQGGSDVGQNRFDHMRVIGNAQLVWDGQQQSVGLGDSFVLPELLDEYMRLGGIATAEDRPRPFVDESDLVIIFAPAPEIGTVTIIHQCEDAAAD